MPEYQKAFIGPYINGHMELEEGFYVPFNPAEISIEEAIGIGDLPQVDDTESVDWMKEGHAMGTYAVGGSRRNYRKGLTTLSTTLFFNTLTSLYQTCYEDVRDQIRKLYRYTNTKEQYTTTVRDQNCQVAEGKTVTHPAQQVYFFWGTIAVAGMLSRMSVNYTMFSPDGKPVRAQVGISIEGFYVGEETVTFQPGPGKGAGGAVAALSGDLTDWKSEYRGCPNPRMLL